MINVAAKNSKSLRIIFLESQQNNSNYNIIIFCQHFELKISVKKIAFSVTKIHRLLREPFSRNLVLNCRAFYSQKNVSYTYR